MPAPAPTHPGVINLQRLLRIRALLLGILLLASLSVHLGFDLRLPLLPVFAVIAALSLLTLASAWQLRQGRRPVSDRQLCAQLLADVLGLTALLYFTGGWTNPLVSLYLVPIAVAVVMLDRRMAWAITVLTIGGYSLLTAYYRPVVAVDHHHMDSFTLHVAGMWLTFVLAAALITHFGSSLVNTLRSRDRALARQREDNLRHEQIIGVATLAAGTAHELSTPLGSIAVIASELASEAEGEQRRQLELLLQQVEVCRETLGRLRQTASGEADTRQLGADTLLQELKTRLQLIRPNSRMSIELDSAGPVPTLPADATLQQALLNLMDNAAAAADTPFECRLHWAGGILQLDILDRGPGFAARNDDGDANAGMGMGLLLANATIERLGGRVTLQERPDGGARVRVELPIAEFEEAP